MPEIWIQYGAGPQYDLFPLNAQDKRITWSSSDESVVTVRSDGWIVSQVDEFDESGKAEAIVTAHLVNSGNEASVHVKPEPEPEPEPEPTPKPGPEPTPKPEPTPTPKPGPKPTPKRTDATTENKTLPQTGDPYQAIPIAPMVACAAVAFALSRAAHE